MELICNKEALDDHGNKLMQFTKGNAYTFEKIEDPEGWEVEDDNMDLEVFFNPYIMFELKTP